MQGNDYPLRELAGIEQRRRLNWATSAAKRRCWTAAWRGVCSLRERGLACGLWQAVAIAPTIGAMAVWASSLSHVDIRRTTDLGLVSALPPSVFFAFVLLTAGFCLALRQQPVRTPLVLLNLMGLAFLLFGTPTLVEEAPRFSITWRLAGNAEYVMRNHAVDPTLDAFFNWPGFFILIAFVTQVAGFANPMSLAGWAPVFFNLVYLGPLIMILRSATPDERLVWLGAWFFFLGNWIGQDYLAPQALGFFFYLVILGVLLRWFKAGSRGRDETVHLRPGAHDAPESGRGPRWDLVARLGARVGYLVAETEVPNRPSWPGQRVGAIAIVVTLSAAVVLSHQLTPFMMLGAVAALVVFRRLVTRSLPILMAVLILTWISYMAAPFLVGHTQMVTGDVGRVGNVVNSNVVDRVQGSPGHIFVVSMRLVMTLAIWLLALVGGVRRLRHGRRDLTLAILAVVPFPLLVLQSYGGEMLLRVYLFALPPVVFFAAACFYTIPTVGASWRTPLAIGLVSALLYGGFLFARYGNERMDYMTLEEVDAVRYLYQVAPPGSVLVVASNNLPWQFQDYEKYRYLSLGRRFVRDKDLDYVVAQMTSGNQNAYLVITRSQKAEFDLLSGFPPGTVDEFEQEIRSSEKFDTIFNSKNATIFVVANS